MVCNGLKAVEMVRKRWEDDQQQFAVIFMDCNMPKMDGYQATENIRQFVESQPEYEQPFIIGISGHIEEKYRQRALDSGMNQIIGKPARLDDIVEALKNTDL